MINENKTIELHQENIKAQGRFNPDYEVMTENNLEAHYELCREDNPNFEKITFQKEYGYYGEIQYTVYECGCQEVIYTPTGTTYLFNTNQKKIRFNVINGYIQALKSYKALGF
jgi:hypothetical protein